MKKHLILSFTTTILLLIFLGTISIVKMVELASLSDKLYKHPFTVTNATKRIESSLISMHSNMKDILLSKEKEELRTIIEKLNKSEVIIYEQFKIIFERYLGDKADIQKSFEAFNSWKPIRDEVIHLIRENKRDEAIKMSSNIGVQHLKYLNLQVNKLIEYAQNKAIFFHSNSLKSKQEAIVFVSIITCVIFFILISIFIYVYISINVKEKETKKYLHLIDQRIMSTKLDIDMNILNVSNAFLRTLGYQKDELIKNPNIIYNDTKYFKKKEVLKILKSGKNWEGEIDILDNEGMKKWLSLQIIPIFNDNYSVVGFNNIFSDISSEKRVEEMATHDALTNLYNRRYFDEIFPKEINIASRNGLSLAFAMIDIDYFKNYNDTYGHQAGDNALISVANVLIDSMHRASDYAFRLGGEEFGLIYFVNNPDEAFNIIDLIRTKVEKLQIKHEDSSISSFLTISCGLKVISFHEKSTMEDIYYETDKALYKAKESGRNRVVKI